MSPGDRVKVISERFNYWGSIGTVLKVDRFHVCIALDDYPDVNHRDYHNRLWFEPEELEAI